ncbi:hypothetical protein SprV_0401598100 [Sparganum proliferum]
MCCPAGSAGSQDKEAIFIATGGFVGNQHSPSGSTVYPDTGTEVTKEDQLVRLRYIRRDCVQIFVELGLRLVGAGRCKNARRWQSAGGGVGLRLRPPGIRTDYRTDDRLLNSRLVQAPTRLSTTNSHDLLFANDCALNVDTEADMQRSMELFATGCANCGLTINTDKTVIMSRPPPNTVYSAPRIHVNGTQLNTMDNFAHLATTL